MTTRQKLIAIRKMIDGSQPEDKFDSLVLSALIDELSGTAPEGNADEVAKKLHARTGYTFPHNAEMKELFDSVKDGAAHIRRLRDDS
ncbi:hypothetical protein [Pantoea sp. 1.19]|uniref:hypothetical protein n=1 Tax=Pantoea sp. 1.19 TaxID=1925589 RepID=UPI000949060D|nr:hypothetical protein [Pantoea sp. 1.19]